jgi:integrase
MHDLRDTSATILLRKSGNIYAVKEHLGHANVKDTQDAYADWINDDKIEASKMLVESLSDLNY